MLLTSINRTARGVLRSSTTVSTAAGPLSTPQLYFRAKPRCHFDFNPDCKETLNSREARANGTESRNPTPGSYIIDVREPNEVIQGMIPSAVTLTGALHLLHKEFVQKDGFTDHPSTAPSSDVLSRSSLTPSAPMDGVCPAACDENGKMGLHEEPIHARVVDALTPLTHLLQVSTTHCIASFAPIQSFVGSGPPAGGRRPNLHGGAPFYETCAYQAGGWMTVGCLQPRLFTVFINDSTTTDEVAYYGAIDREADAKQPTQSVTDKMAYVARYLLKTLTDGHETL
ncbi:hypothetical protein D9619_004968 [Psilocybe cf. subviscida]|uniref:Rhodanese domain-containing protein n=1 Tax=Psilocybe cf. subviscida TaxID=2480587 RepID=A0A8H5F8Q2_9AGAR|nr:hypothetical protein D9619_004968 [Psilocybe cf. subviscida]